MVSCVDCESFRDRITSLEEDLEELLLQKEDCNAKLEISKTNLTAAKERESKLR